MHTSRLPADRQSGAPDGSAVEGDELSGWRLAGQSVGYFLLPLAAAIVSAAAVDGENMRIMSGVAAFVLTTAAAAIIGRWGRRRRKEPQ